MDNPAKKMRPATGSLTAEAYSRIRSEILRCKLPPGQKLIIQDICNDMGFSLGAVREALSRLTAEGLVEAQPRKGFRVTPVTEAELKDITDVRITIETQCLERSIKHGDLKWESTIMALLFELSKLDASDLRGRTGLNERWAKTHKQFHEALVAACDSAWLLRLRETLYAHSERYRWMSQPLDKGGRNVHAEHEAIAKAVIDRETKEACTLISQHISRTSRIIVESRTARD